MLMCIILEIVEVFKGRSQFGEMKSRKLHKEDAVASWYLRTVTALDWKLQKTKETSAEMAVRRASEIPTDFYKAVQHTGEKNHSNVP
jgi:hypothetical protein